MVVDGARHFDEIDTDKDGTVSLAEINTYMSAKHATNTKQ